MVTLFAILLSMISLFLILLVLVQRGRGGGLTGALGGMGGQSAFGTKAGDTFTRVTIVAATVWILVAILALKMLSGSGGKLGDANAAQAGILSGAASTAEPDTNADPLSAAGDAALDGTMPPVAGASSGLATPPAENDPTDE